MTWSRHIPGLLLIGGLVLGYFLLVVDLVTAEQFGLVFDILFALVMGNTVIAFLRMIGAECSAARLTGLAIAILAAGARLMFPETVQLAPYLAIVLINAFVAYVFGHAMVTGGTPFIVQLIRVTGCGPECSPEFERYVRGQCWCWTGFGAVTALCGAIGMVSPSSRPVFDNVIGGLFLLQILWLPLAHHYARFRYDRPESWLDTVRSMSRPETWTGLKI